MKKLFTLAAIVIAMSSMAQNSKPDFVLSSSYFYFIPGTVCGGSTFMYSEDDDETYKFYNTSDFSVVKTVVPTINETKTWTETATVTVTGAKLKGTPSFDYCYTLLDATNIKTSEELVEALKTENPYTSFSVCIIPGYDYPAVTEGNFYCGTKCPTYGYCVIDGKLNTFRCSYEPIYDETTANWTKSNEESYSRSTIEDVDYYDYDSNNHINENQCRFTKTLYNSDDALEWIEGVYGNYETSYENYKTSENSDGTFTLTRDCYYSKPRIGYTIMSENGAIATINANDAGLRKIYKTSGKIYLVIDYTEGEETYTGLFRVTPGSSKIEEIVREHTADSEVKARKLLKEGRIVIESNGKFYTTDGVEIQK